MTVIKVPVPEHGNAQVLRWFKQQHRRKQMNKWWSIFAAIGMSAVTAVTPAVQGALSHHPVATAVIGSVVAVVMHFLPSPTGGAQ